MLSKVEEGRLILTDRLLTRWIAGTAIPILAVAYLLCAGLAAAGLLNLGFGPFAFIAAAAVSLPLIRNPRAVVFDPSRREVTLTTGCVPWFRRIRIIKFEDIAKADVGLSLPSLELGHRRPVLRLRTGETVPLSKAAHSHSQAHAIATAVDAALGLTGR